MWSWSITINKSLKGRAQMAQESFCAFKMALKVSSLNLCRLNGTFLSAIAFALDELYSVTLALLQSLHCRIKPSRQERFIPNLDKSSVLLHALQIFSSLLTGRRLSLYTFLHFDEQNFRLTLHGPLHSSQDPAGFRFGFSLFRWAALQLLLQYLGLSVRLKHSGREHFFMCKRYHILHKKSRSVHCTNGPW